MTIDGAYLTSGAAALHALPADEAAEFEAFAAQDETCAAEMAGFRETAAMLGSVVAETPPASMRANVMRLITNTRQLPPLTEDSRGRHAAAPEEAPAPGVTSLAAVRERRFGVGAKWLVAAAAAAILVTGTLFFVNRDSTSQDPAVAMANCVAQDTAAKTVEGTPDSMGKSQVVVSASCNAATFSVWNLDPLQPNSSYQLWVMQGTTGARSVGLLHTDANGNYPQVTAEIKPGDTDMGISVEPAAGSPAPTTAPIVVVPIST
ncbi:hypothetical protein D1871_15425 [Nakamurella silvestris]|nr:hypothetical protein D1871_15425 [Nakamurella silvestris]